jgi:hypothetical protein
LDVVSDQDSMRRLREGEAAAAAAGDVVDGAELRQMTTPVAR